MKHLLYTFICCVTILACKQEQAVTNDNYTITINAKGMHNGMRAYLKAKDEKGRFQNRDTAMVVNEKIVFTGKAIRPEFQYLFINGVNGNLPVIIENKDFTIALDNKSITKSNITGSEANNELNTFNTEQKKFVNTTRQLNVSIRRALAEGNTEKVNELKNELNTHLETVKNFRVDFTKKSKSEAYKIASILNLLQNKNFSIADTENLFNDLPNSFKSSEQGKQIAQTITVEKEHRKALAGLTIGDKVPNFSAKTPEGKELALNDIKGKITIIDFWAAWCGPCRRENPNVVKVYEKYHDKGLEIIGVSLDKAGQAQRWKDAIAKDKLTWHHVSNLKHWKDPIARMYNVRSIPATFIIDESGTIVAKNLRGSALEKKIGELLN